MPYRPLFGVLLVGAIGCSDSDEPQRRAGDGGADGASDDCLGDCIARTGDAIACATVCGSGGAPAGGAGGASDPAAPGETDPVNGEADGAPPGSACRCDADCKGDATHPGVCVAGICMTRATGPCAHGGSSGECGAGSRCWQLRNSPGTHLCWPDCASFSCDGTCDGDGSCVYPADGTCDPTCGAHCPPGAAPCSPENPAGFCDPGERCVEGVCETPCSEASPEGYCPPGRTCEAGTCINTAGCPDWRCTGDDCSDIILMPGSTDPHSAQAIEDGYYLAHAIKYSYLRRDLTMLMRWAACEVRERFPDRPPLGLADLSQADGQTPGTDVGRLRHPSTTHRGNDLDIAYYQTDGLNNPQIICGDGSDRNGNRCCGQYNDGQFCTTSENIIDWPPQAYFFAKMATPPEARIFGIDQTLVDDFNFHLDQLVASGDITQTERDRVRLGYGLSGGWQFHHHHVHLSYCRIGYSGGGCPRPLIIGPADDMEPFISPWLVGDGEKGSVVHDHDHDHDEELDLLDLAIQMPVVDAEKGYRIGER